MGRTCGTYGERIGAYRALVGKPEGRRPLGRPRRRWEDNTRWFKYDRDYLCVNKSQFVPVIFEPPCIQIDLREFKWGAWTGSIWLRIGTGGGLL
jgi:hypothetical protein